MENEYTYRPLHGELFFIHGNTIYINSNALDRSYPTKKGTFDWLRKSTEERIEASPYRDRIQEVIQNYPTFGISEFLPR